MNQSDPNQTHTNLHQFGRETVLEDAGFSFHPILDLELEIDGSVYMYSEEGNLEIYLIGGALDDGLSITDLNHKLTADVMEHLGEYDWQDAGTDTIQGISGFPPSPHSALPASRHDARAACISRSRLRPARKSRAGIP